MNYEIDPITGCWVFQGAKSDGYGSIRHEGRSRGAHRVMYEAMVGPVPEGLDLDHLCRNRACVNPGHLEPVTRAENVRRGALPKLTKAQVIEIKGLRGVEKQVRLAERFGVCRATICMIFNGQRWGDVDEEAAA